MAKVIEGGSNTTEKRMKDLAEAIAKNALKNAQEAKKVEKSVNAPPAAVSKTVQDSAQSLNRAVTKAVTQASITPAERTGVKAVTTGVKAGLDGWADGLKNFGAENAAALGLDTTSGGYFSRSFLDTDATSYLDKINSILKKQYNNSPERREAIYNLTEAEKMVTFTKRQVDLQSAVYTREPSEANKLILEKGKAEYQSAITSRDEAKKAADTVFKGDSEYEPVTAENLDRRLGYLDRSYEKSVKYLEGSGAKIEDMQAQLAAAETELSASYSNYAQFPTQENSEKLSAAAKKYNETVAAHNEAVEKHNAHYSEFENLSNAYNQIVKAERERGMKEEAWRHSVRSYDQIGEINLELKEVTNELALAEARRQQLTSRAIKPNELNTYYTQLDSYNAQIEELTAKKALLEEEAEWSRNFYYAELPHELDFAEKSRYVSTYAPGTEKKGIDGKYLSTGFVDIIYDYINKDEVATKRKELAEAAGNSDVWGMSAKVYNQMSDEEIAIFNYLYAKDIERGDTEHTSAYDYIKYLQSDLNSREREESEKYFAKVAEEHPWVTSALTVVTSPMKAFTYAMQTADLINDGKIEQSAAYNKWSYIPSTIRENVSDNWGPVGSFLYNTGMSFADSLYQVAITGGFSGGGALSKAAISLITSSGAAADKIIEAKDKGITDGRSYVLGTLTGIVEGVAEHLSLDALLGGKWSKNAVQFTLKNAAAEGGEEIGAEFFGTIADILVLKDQSEWIERINAYKEQGDSDARAVARAFGDELLELLVAGAAGAISGGAMGAIEAPAGSAQRKAYKQMGSELREGSTEGVQRLIEKGLLLESNSDGYQLARKMKGTVDKALKNKKVNNNYELAKNKLSDYDIGNLLALILEGNGAAAQNATAAQSVQEEPAQNAEPAQALPPTRGIMAPTPEQKGVMMPTIEDFFAQKEAAQAALPVQSEQKAAGDVPTPTATDTTAQTTPTQTTTKELTELERSGMEAGASTETIQQVKRLSEAIGREIRLYSGRKGENGKYDTNTGIIHVNVNSDNPTAQIIAHELTHSLESTREYAKLSSLVLKMYERSGADIDSIRSQKAALYEKYGRSLKSTKEIDYEIVAEYVEKHLLTDEIAILDMVRQNRRLGHRILEWLRSLLARLRGKDTRERAFIQRAVNLYARALDSSRSDTRGMDAEHRSTLGRRTAEEGMRKMRRDEVPDLDTLRELYAAGEISEAEYDELYEIVYDAEEDINTEHSFGGRNVGSADLDALKKAQEMQELGVAEETILQETGWYQGADGKWRHGDENTELADDTEEQGMQYSISEIEGQNGSYGMGVLLDTNIFNGVRPRNWGDVLGKHVYKNMSGAELTMYDEGGNAETVYLARENDRVKKDGAKNSHKVIDKLARYKGDNIRALATVHLPEALAVSGNERFNNEHTHQWMDEKGWTHRTAYLQDKSGNIYEATLNIANGRERRVLYDINNIRKIDTKKEATDGAVPSTENGRGSHISSSFKGSITENELPVKEKFSISEPVEQTETLLALHNMTEEKLRYTLNLGAWPAPSVAIVQATQGHEGYGEYSAVFPRSAIDPQVDSRNRVYGSDAWTPTHSNAQVEYEVNYGVKWRFDDMVSELTRDFAGGALHQSAVLGTSGIEDVTTDNIDKVAEKMSRKESVQAAYLASRGETIEPTYRAKKFDSLGNELLQQYIDSVGAQELASIMVELETTNEISDETFEAVRDIFLRDWIAKNERVLNRKPELKEKRIEVQRSKFERYRAEKFVRNAWDYYEDGGATTGEIDKYATAEKVTNRLSELSPDGSIESIERMVQDWVRGEIEGLLGEPGIFNGRERFDSKGNRKSFQQLHYTLTAENIVRAMYEQGKNRGEGLWGASAEGMVGVASPEYGSVEEIHADETRLRTVSEDEYDAVMRRIDAEIGSFIYTAKQTMEAHSENDSEESDIISYVLLKAAGSKNAQEVRKVFRREGYDLPVELAQQAMDIYQIARQTPTKYFEAKPERVVEFDEAVAVVAPDDAPIELLAAMRNAGMNVVEYETGSEQSRLDTINNLEGAKFSITEAAGNSETEPVGPIKLKLPGGEQNKAASNQPTGPIKLKLPGGEQADVTSTIPVKAQKKLREIERNLLAKIGASFSVPRHVQRDTLQGIVQEISTEFLKTGTVAESTIDKLFEQAYDAGIVIDEEYYNQYKHLKDFLRREGVTLSQEDRNNIPDWNSFRQSAFGTLKIVNNGVPVDVRYMELQEMAPELFPDDITHPAQQLERMFDVAQSIQRTEHALSESSGDNEEEFKQWLKRDFDAEINNALAELRLVKRYIDDRAKNSDTQGGEQEEPSPNMPAKAQQELRKAEWHLLNSMGKALGVPNRAQRKSLDDIAKLIATEYLRTGRVSQESLDGFFETAYEAGLTIDEEFYNQYKDIEESLRTQSVTILEKDRKNFSDWNSFRENAYGTLNIVNGGETSVDKRYKELQKTAPELFPSDISYPAEQLKRMYDIGSSIQLAKKSLNEAHSEDAEEFKRWRKNDFEKAVNNCLRELWLVKRYIDESTKKSNAQETELTIEQVTAMYGRLKEARRNYEKVAAKNLLTESDEKQVGRLLRGDIDLKDLDPEKDNVQGIKAVYEAKQEYEGLVRSIREWNNSRKAKLREEADALLENAINWRDKRTGIQYSRETMERNIKDIVDDPKLAEKIIAEYFTPVHTAQAEATRMKNRYRERVEEMKLSRKIAKGNEVSEAHAVQLLGEAEDNIRVILDSKGRIKTRDGKSLDDWRGIVQNLWANNPNLDRQKITDAVQKFRKIYDELFTQMNEARVRNGYEPVNYRSGYFPHFQPGDEGILAQFGKALGIDMSVPALPTSINGLTHTFKPGIQWFGNAQERLGFNTAYDAVEGFDRYIEGVADVIHQTDNIQKLRALARQIRYRTGDEGIRKQIDAIMADTTLQEEDRQNRVEKIHENGKFVLNKFILELEEYTNLLANKKSRHDRSMEDNLNRQIYTAAQNIESRIAANMVAINPASWLTNFIPLTQGGAQLHTGTLLKSMWDTLKSYRDDDGIVNMSTFLTNRRGSDPLVKTWSQNASAKMASPMEFIDNFTADTLVRARYQQNKERGLSEYAAMSEADSWVAGVMADRSKGAMPTLFSRKNPLAKVFTQFQLEVNNQLSYLFKDIPREAKEKGAKGKAIRALTAALIKFCLGAFLYNEVYEFFIGRRPALDPLGILNDTVGDITGYELPNLVELGVGAVSGDMPSFEVERKNAHETGKALGTNIAEELPFVGSLLGGGRLPIDSAIPDFDTLWTAASNNEWDSKKRIYTAIKELGKPAAYLAPPFGGGQIKKAVEGVWAVADGGSYTVDGAGNDILQYPIYNDSVGQTVINAAGATIFGKTSLPTARDWIESGFKNLSAKETASYKGMTEAGVPDEEAFTLIQDLKGKEKLGEKLDVLMSSDISAEGKAMAYYSLFAIEDTERPILDDLIENDREFTAVANTLMDMRALGEETEGKAYKKREILLNADISPEAAGVIYYNLMAEDKDKQLIDKLEESGVEIGSSARTILQIKQVSKDTVPDGIPSNEKRTLIMETNFSDAQKKILYNYTFGDPQADGSYLSSKADTIKAFEDADLNFDQFLAAQNEYTSINAADMAASEKALDFSKWVYSQTLTVKQHELMAESFTFFAQIPQNAEKLDNLVSAGIDSDTAHELMKEIGALEPLEGAKQISDAQQCRVVVNSGLSEADQMTALSVVMNDGSYAKLKACYDTVGITPSIYVAFLEYLPHYDADASGGYKQEEVKAAIDAMSGGNGQLPAVYLTTGDKAALWQMANKGWKGKNNPYSSSIGQQVYGAMNPDKE